MAVEQDNCPRRASAHLAWNRAARMRTVEVSGTAVPVHYESHGVASVCDCSAGGDSPVPTNATRALADCENGDR